MCAHRRSTIGERTHMPDYPEEGAPARRAHPDGRPVPGLAADDTGRFRSRAEPRRDSFVRPRRRGTPSPYCRIGERSSHTWFVLTHLLGIPGVRNYDGPGPE